MADPLAPNAEEEAEEEIAELIKGVKRHGGELSLAYRPFRRIPGMYPYVASASSPRRWKQKPSPQTGVCCERAGC